MTSAKKLKHDPDDFDDLLLKVEDSFGIKFERGDFKNTKTFGELCDIILEKINLPNVNDSTHQQAFYKLRNAIAVTKNIDKNEILPETKLSDLFPRQGRKKIIRELEFELGFNLKVLRPNLLLEMILLLSFLGAIVFLFISFMYGIELLALFFVLNTIAFKTGKEFNCETVGDLAKKVTKENYKKARRNPETINEQEVIRQLELIFGEFVSDSEEITRETKIP